jgi:hypothetical protein
VEDHDVAARADQHVVIEVVVDVPRRCDVRTHLVPAGHRLARWVGENDSVGEAGAGDPRRAAVEHKGRATGIARCTPLHQSSLVPVEGGSSEGVTRQS